MLRLVRVSLFITCLMYGFNLFAATYYVDYSSGSDSNNGTSKTSPWQHAPGMTGCVGNCAGANPKAGDSVILKGGVTWPNAVFPWAWKWSGSGSAPIYLGVDSTWYSGNAWAQPVFDADNSVINPGGYNVFVRFVSGTKYVTLDNVEMKDFYWNSSSQSYGAIEYIEAAGCTYITLENLYLHHWTHHDSSDGTGDNLALVLGDTNSPYCQGCLFQNGTIDGSDGDSDAGQGFYGFGSVLNSVIHDIPNGILPAGLPGTTVTVSGNTIYNITTSFSGSHENFLETVANMGTLVVYNNLFHDGVGEASFISNFTGEVDYFYNNVIYNLSGNEPEFCGPNCGSVYAWNNTIVPKAGLPCFHQGHGGTMGTVDLRNNHCITTYTAIQDNINASQLTTSPNVLMTPTVATSQGYTVAGSYAPLLGSGGTKQAGTDLSAQCSASYPSLCVALSMTNPPQPGTQRAAGSSPWDAGAYTIGGPPPPINLTAVVN